MNKIIKILLVIHVLLVATVVSYNSGFNFMNPMMLCVFVGLTTYALSIILNQLHKIILYMSLAFSFVYIVLNAGMAYWFIFGSGAGRNGGGEIVIVSFFVPGLLFSLTYTVQTIMTSRKTEPTIAA